MGPIYTVQDILDMIKRRFGMILAVTILGCGAALVFAMNQTHLYHSVEIIQIEQSTIAEELAVQTVEGSSARPLQLIEQQLMSRKSLTQIVEKYDLYGNMPSLLISDKVFNLRRAVAIDGVAAVREGFADDGKIAILSIRVELDDPVLAQKVAHDLADRTRALSTSRRQAQAEETLAFFSEQERNMQMRIEALEREIEAYRIENGVAGEGNADFILTEVATLNASILDLDRAIIEAQLARTQIDRSARRSTVQRMEQEIDAQLETLAGQRQLLDERREGLRLSLQTSPEVDRALSRFDRQMAQLQSQITTIAARRTDAQVGFSLENASHGEQMTTLEEAVVPDHPVTSSRKKTALMGAVASVGLAMVIAWLMELRHPVIRSARQMTRETGLIPVVSIPEVRRPGFFTRMKRAQKRRSVAAQHGRQARLARSATRS